MPAQRRPAEMLRHAQAPIRASAMIPPAMPIQTKSAGSPADVVGGDRGRPAAATVGVDAAATGGVDAVVSTVSTGSTSSPIGVTDDPWAKAQSSYTHLRAHETRHDLVCRLL